jgi:hypothetical protein
METNTNTILSFQEFVKHNAQGQVGTEMPATEFEPMHDEFPTPVEEPTMSEPVGDDMPVPAQEPISDEPETDSAVHMTDDETGEADAPAVDANVMMDDEPKKD